jgi:endonuclease YncB( thermonuclease family)
MRFLAFTILAVLCVACDPPGNPQGDSPGIAPPIRGTAPLVESANSTSPSPTPSSADDRSPANAREPAGLAHPENTVIGPPVDRILLDGVETAVHWPDGDSLNIESGQYSGSGARIAGYNTLEAYGNVQRWGDWSYEGLAAVRSRSKDLARSRTWECSNTRRSGGFDRILLDCESLRDQMVGQGLAHLFTIHERLPSSAVEAQAAARAQALGMWAHGVPEQVLTSVTSTADGYSRTFDRYVDPVTGQAERAFHDESYETCAEVCRYGSCMLYIPQDRRFGRDSIRCDH